MEKKDLEKVLMMRHGQPMKCPLTCYPPAMVFRGGTASVGKCYFAAPVSEVLLAAVRGSGKGSIYVTGVSLELDVDHESPLDFLAFCGAVPASRDVHRVGINVEAGQFALGGAVLDHKGQQADFCAIGDASVSDVARAVFSEEGRDKTLFTAPIASNASVLSGQVTVNGKSQGTGKKVSLNLARRGDADADIDKRFVRDTIRVWWDVKKVLTVCDAAGGNPLGDYYSIVCGVRRQVDAVLGPMKEVGGGGADGPVVGTVKNVRVVVHVRR